MNKKSESNADKYSYERVLSAFTDEMRKRFEQKDAGGWVGWCDFGWRDEMAERMRWKTEAIEAAPGDAKHYMDIANFALFIWFIDHQP